eukprot:1186935-Prorocentrum_minimum.AAC.1
MVCATWQVLEERTEKLVNWLNPPPPPTVAPPKPNEEVRSFFKSTTSEFQKSQRAKMGALSRLE